MPKTKRGSVIWLSSKRRQTLSHLSYMSGASLFFSRFLMFFIVNISSMFFWIALRSFSVEILANQDRPICVI
ncbi:hypothetical protein HAX54_021903 [Datura stramonium]|uniref:Uncharacterized protein n=1 Tax=Datura stramonium TaxID=4076 RepID=A0ABS8S4K3_DATST|nr:hypothetical protein [Datura stramonium]